jgi:hypothetical protein
MDGCIDDEWGLLIVPAIHVDKMSTMFLQCMNRNPGETSLNS